MSPGAKNAQKITFSLQFFSGQIFQNFCLTNIVIELISYVLSTHMTTFGHFPWLPGRKIWNNVKKINSSSQKFLNSILLKNRFRHLIVNFMWFILICHTMAVGSFQYCTESFFVLGTVKNVSVRYRKDPTTMVWHIKINCIKLTIRWQKRFLN